MKQADTSIPLPDPDFLRAHYQISKILHGCGTREKMRDTLLENAQMQNIIRKMKNLVTQLETPGTIMDRNYSTIIGNVLQRTLRGWHHTL